MGWGQAGESPELGQGCLASGGLVPGGRGHFVFMGRGTVAEGEGARGWIQWRCSWDHLGNS